MHIKKFKEGDEVWVIKPWYEGSHMLASGIVTDVSTFGSGKELVIHIGEDSGWIESLVFHSEDDAKRALIMAELRK